MNVVAALRLTINKAARQRMVGRVILDHFACQNGLQHVVKDERVGRHFFIGMIGNTHLPRTDCLLQV